MTNTCVQNILRTTEKLKECVKCHSDLHLSHLFATSCILQLGNLTYLLSKAQSCHLLFISGTGKGFRASAHLKDLGSCLQNVPDVCWSQTNHIYISFSFFLTRTLFLYYLLIFGGIFKNNSWYLAGSMLHYYWINSCLLTHKANSELNWIIGFMGETHRWLQVFLFWKRVKFLRRCFWRKWSHV